MVLIRPRVRPAVRPSIADLLLALGLGVAAVLVDVFGHLYRDSAALIWDIALTAPLVLRRRSPAVASALVGAICFAQWLDGPLASGDLAVLVMLYSLGAWERRRWLLATAVVVAQIGVIMALTKWAPPAQPWLSAVMMTGTVTAAWVVGRYVLTRRAYLTSMIERAETAERDRDHQAQIAVAEERTRLAREMHDVIAHSLAVMITLNDAIATITDAGTVRDTATQASDVGRQALAEMHRMLGVLRTAEPADQTPQPGTDQLADLISMVRSAGLSVELTTSGDPAGLAPTTQLAIYRIVQESLTNVLKHARNVTQVVVAVSYLQSSVRVRVSNNGDQCPPDDLNSVGHGLAGMRERTALYGGHIMAGPVQVGGWEVLAELTTTASPAVLA